MRASDLVLVRGLADTRATLRRWNLGPWPVLRRWLAGATAITTGLLLAVWVIASQRAPGLGLEPSSLQAPPTLGAAAEVIGRNSLVLALHAMACVAGFIAGSSLPLAAGRHRGPARWAHEKAGGLAIAFVVGATGFSLVTQALVLGQGAADLAAALDLSPGVLLLGVLPHALPELIALFLPLAAWIVASRRADWNELLAATLVTVAIAAPVVVAAAFVEVFVTPDLLRALAG